MLSNKNDNTMTIHFSTLSNNKYITESILLYGAHLHINTTKPDKLYHMDTYKQYDKLYIHHYILPIGETTIKFNNENLTITRERNSSEPLGYHAGTKIDYFYDIYIKTKKKNLKLINQFIEHALDFYKDNFIKKKKRDNIVKCFIYDDGYWEALTEHPKRSIDTIYLNNNETMDILNDMNQFLSKEIKERYRIFGIPYKKNYLFEGYPGTGKTSLSYSLAGELAKDIAIINFDRNITDNDFMRAVKSIPDDVILCLEDIDVLFEERKKSDTHKSMISFSALLNTLDGHAYKDGLICILTTNYINRLDPALKRPGRIDYTLHFDYATKNQIKKMFNIFFPKSKKTTLKKLLAIISKLKITISVLQKFFFMNYQCNNILDKLPELQSLCNDHNYNNDKHTNFYS